MTLIQKLLISLLLVIFIPHSYAQDRALLVGIDKYWYVGALEGCVQDVKNMQGLVQSIWGYRVSQIRTLTDTQATRENILNTFDNWLIKESNPGDKILFYFSGHGYYVADDDGDESDGYDETLCPVDTRGTRAMIRDDEINARLQHLKGRKVTVIIDAGYAGSVTQPFTQSEPTIKVPVFEIPTTSKHLKRRLTKEHIERDNFITPQPDVIAYSAVASNQEALIDTSVTPYRSVFTCRLIRGLQGRLADSNYDGKITLIELLEYTRHKSQAYCDKKPQQCKTGRLTPQLEVEPEMLLVDAHAGVASMINNTVDQTTSVLVHDNKAHLQIKVLPQHHRFKVGEMIKIQIRSDHDGYLLFFDVNSKGALMRLFPNQYVQLEDQYGYLVKAGQTLTIPSHFYGFNFMAEKPLGAGVLVALLVEDKLSHLHKLPSKALELVPAKPALTVLQQLRQQLNQTVQQENAANRPVRWSIATFEYEVISATREN